MDQQQYILRWHYQESTLCKTFVYLLESSLMTDCTIWTRNKSFKAHKIILASCSGYFFDIFQNISQSESPVVVLYEANDDEIEAILSYIYKGRCLISQEQVPRLLQLAKVLKIKGLCNVKASDISGKSHCDDLMKAEQNVKPRQFIEYNSNGNFKENEDLKQDAAQMDFSKKTLKDSSEVCKCFVCGKYLSNQYNLRVHMETHKDAYYSCVSCPHVSKSRDALRKHVSYRHPEEYTMRKRKKHS